MLLTPNSKWFSLCYRLKCCVTKSTNMFWRKKNEENFMIYRFLKRQKKDRE